MATNKKTMLEEARLKAITRRKLNELNNSTVGSAIRKGQNIGRSDQTNNMIQMKLLELNKNYCTVTIFGNHEFKFGALFHAGKFCIYGKSDVINNVVLIPEDDPMGDGSKDAVNEPFVQAIQNMKAGERMKFNKLRQTVIELNASLDGKNDNVQESKQYNVVQIDENQFRQIVKEVATRIMKEAKQ